MRYCKTSLPRSSSYYEAAAALVLLISILVIPGTIYGQFRASAFGAQFDMAVSQSIDPDKGSIIVVNAAVDYRRLVFFRKDGYYQARYRVYVDIEKKNGRSPAGEVWEESLSVEDYRETRSPNLRSVIRRSFPAGPGEYKVTVIIEIIGASRKYRREEKIRVVGGEEGGIQLSTPTFYMPGAGVEEGRPARDELSFSFCSSPDEQGFVQIPGAVYVEFDSWMRIHTGMILPGDGGEKTSLACRITDAGGRTIAYNRQDIYATGQIVESCFDIDADHLPIGFYNFSVSAVRGDAEERTTKEEPFVILLNKGLFYENFPSLLSLLSIIAEDDELSALEESPVEDRKAEWDRFWDRRSPTVDGEVNEGLSEFLRRVKFTLRTFSRRRPGWETDMGKVFIRNGNPDRITDRSGNQYAMGSAYQLWYYDSKGLVYIFQNTMGGGEYRLIDTQMY